MTEGSTTEGPFGQTPSPPEVATAAASALFLGYSAPMPGVDSRYSDGTAAHETRLLGVPALAGAVSGAATRTVGETVLEAILGSHSVSGRADLRAAGYLAPLARTALLGERVGKVLAGLSHEDARLFVQALETVGPGHLGGALEGALNIALGAGRSATLRDAMRFAAERDPMAREYARDFEVTRELARPALFAALARLEAARPAFVQAYLEVLAEAPDLDVASRAGRKEAEEVSRMANGVLKAGGVSSRRGLQGITNLDGILRTDRRLSPSATEPPVIAAAFLISLEYGSDFLNYRVRPAPGR
ncbi:MAG TPA: triphosphoribosyl-dephospho-CoA synthase [Rubrobacteraceae bacterium]|nr:triphosphoribosyl-dephospho-CoA synthase [Rubrobacteraceae bacterium]